MRQNKKVITFLRRQKKRVDEESQFRQWLKSKRYCDGTEKIKLMIKNYEGKSNEL